MRSLARILTYCIALFASFGSGLSPYWTDESRFLASLPGAPVQVFVETWLPLLQLAVFSQDLAPCCINQPQYLGESRFLCLTEEIQCVLRLSGLGSVGRISPEIKTDPSLIGATQDEYFLLEVHTVIPVTCDHLLNYTKADCGCAGAGNLEHRFHQVYCDISMISTLAGSHLVGHVARASLHTKHFASKGSSWIAQTGGDSPAPFVPQPRYFERATISANAKHSIVSLSDGLPQLDHAFLVGSDVTVVPLVPNQTTSWSFHGTHLAGIIAGAPSGDASLESYGGISPGVRLVVVETNPHELSVAGPWSFWQAAATAGSAVHVDPWGTLPTLSSREPLWYTSFAFEVDEFFWKHRFILNVRAHGVPVQPRGSIAFSEVSSKNAIIIGSSFTNTIDLLEQRTMFFPPTFEPQCQFYHTCNFSLNGDEFCFLYLDRLDDLMPHDQWFCRYINRIVALGALAFSGQRDLLYTGLYLTDGRVRPHLLLPGTAVVSALPGHTSPLGLMSGTSVSTAVAGGMAALIADYFQSEYKWQELLPGNTTERVPASLLRATLLAGSRVLKADALGASSLASLPENPGLSRTYSGYGRPQLNLLMPVRDEFSLVVLANEQQQVVDETRFSPDPTTFWCFQLNQLGGLLTVALTWPDPPAAFLSTALMLNRLKLSVREPNSGATYVDTVQSGNEQVISFVPTSENIEISVTAWQIVHNGSYSMTVLTTADSILSERPCPACVPGTKTPCYVPGGIGEATCTSNGYGGGCRVVSCSTGLVPTASTASCQTLPSVFILTTAVTIAVCLILLILLTLLLVMAAYKSRVGCQVISRWQILSYSRLSSTMMVLLVIFSSLCSLMAAFSSFLTASATDKAQDPSNSISEFGPVLVAVIATNIGQMISAVGVTFLQQILTATGARRLRCESLRIFAEQEVLTIVASGQQNTADLLIPCAVVMSRPPQLTTALTNSLSKLGISLIILFALEWRISFAALGCLAALSVWTVVSTTGTKFVSRLTNQKNVNFHALRVSLMSLIEWIQVNDINVAGIDRPVSRDLAGWTASSYGFNLVSSQVSSAVIEVTAIAVFCVALRSLQTGQLTFGLLMVFFQWMSQIVGAFMGLFGVLNGWFGFKGESEQLLCHLNRKRRSRGDQRLNIHANLQLSTSDLSFHYPQTVIGFDNVSLIIPPTKLSMLMGPSGVGKSSLLQILVGIIRPDRGRIMMDGYDIGLLAEEAIFSAMTLVEQDVMLKRGTLQQNVCIGLEDDEQIPEHLLRISESVGASGWIAGTPLGWQTPVTSGGTTLSGGQRKLIGILRALARDTPIVLGDEVTSGLDPCRAAQVISTFIELKRTVLMTTHQMELVGFAGAVFTLSRLGLEVWSAPLTTAGGLSLGGARRLLH